MRPVLLCRIERSRGLENMGEKQDFSQTKILACPSVAPQQACNPMNLSRMKSTYGVFQLDNRSSNRFINIANSTGDYQKLYRFGKAKIPSRELIACDSLNMDSAVYFIKGNTVKSD